MALLPILRFPDPRLRKVAVPITNIDDGIRRLAADMAETMYEAPGIGLAATQVNVHEQVIVIDVSEDKSKLLTLINPEILAREGECEGEFRHRPTVVHPMRPSECMRVTFANSTVCPDESISWS